MSIGVIRHIHVYTHMTNSKRKYHQTDRNWSKYKYGKDLFGFCCGNVFFSKLPLMIKFHMLCSCIINLKSKISTFGFYSSSREIVFQLHTMNIKKIHIVALIAFPHQVSERTEKMFC